MSIDLAVQLDARMSSRSGKLLLGRISCAWKYSCRCTALQHIKPSEDAPSGGPQGPILRSSTNNVRDLFFLDVTDIGAIILLTKMNSPRHTSGSKGRIKHIDNQQIFILGRYNRGKVNIGSVKTEDHLADPSCASQSLRHTCEEDVNLLHIVASRCHCKIQKWTDCVIRLYFFRQQRAVKYYEECL
jgi:hypothetical protein